jgi:hypothetical protein
MRLNLPDGGSLVPPPGAAVYVLDGQTGAALVHLPGMSRYGPDSSLASPGDVNSDRWPDFFMGGALLDSGAGPESGRVVVALSHPPPPAGPPPAPAPPPSDRQPISRPGDTTNPVLTALRLSPRTFHATRAGLRASSQRGTTVSYKLSETAAVTFKVEQALRGRLVDGQCVKSTPARRGAQKCTRYGILRGNFTRAGRKGANTFRFKARIGGRALQTGRYRIRARATDAAGNHSTLRRSAFRIVRL